MPIRPVSLSTCSLPHPSSACMKPLSAILLIFSLFTPVLFTTAWKQLHRWQVRQDLKKLLLTEEENPHLIWLKLSPEQAGKLKWEGKSEFEHCGTMYDLVRLQTSGDTLLLLCWPDLAETGLSHQLDKLLSHRPGRQEPQSQPSLQDFLKSLPFLSLASQDPDIPFTEGKTPSCPAPYLSAFPPTPPSPPPNCGTALRP